MKTKKIDIKKIVQEKNEKLVKIPFLVFLLRRLIHEKKLNEFLDTYGYLYGVEFAKAGLKFLNVKVEVKFMTPLVAERPYIFAANHPLGGLDGIALIKAISSIFSKMRFLANSMLMNLENFQSLFLPVNKDGSQTRDIAVIIDDAYADKTQQILIFPAGLVSRKIKGKVVDLDWKKHFAMKAIKHQRDVVPVYIDGKNSSWFYSLANWRKRLKIKTNIERNFLADELFRQQGKTLTIVFGEPILYYELQCMPVDERADFVKNKVYELEKAHKNK
jgi:putative hemolysin